ncbi:hypothetical protein Scep_021777 [Stephania cephalantha]|uniref:Uncharacterized protein n=1 Tax=Stephania cephalantha TaxID=152367 RepID=A0AAP0FC71_9MAGN
MDASGGADSGAIGVDVGIGGGCKDDGGGIGPDVGVAAGCDVDGPEEVLLTKEILSFSINASSIHKSRFAKFVETILIPNTIVPIVHISSKHLLGDMMKQLIDNQQQFQRLLEELQRIDFEIPGLKELETQFIQYNAKLQNMIDEEELWGNEMKIDGISNKPEKPQIENEEDQPQGLVQPPTLQSTFGTPYKR